MWDVLCNALAVLLVVAASIGWAIVLEVTRRRTDAGLAPDQLRRKRALEETVDRLTLP